MPFIISIVMAALLILFFGGGGSTPNISKSTKNGTNPIASSTTGTVRTIPAPRPPSPKPALLPQPAVNIGDIIALTNRERIKARLQALRANAKLQQIAQDRVRDMTKNNYFAHESPDGKDMVGLSQSVGYQYHFLGENLASGDFGTSADLVNAWMNSPPHRENILKSDYTEIGVAAEFGEFLGRKQWIAVQIFGTR